MRYNFQEFVTPTEDQSPEELADKFLKKASEGDLVKQGETIYVVEGITNTLMSPTTLQLKNRETGNLARLKHEREAELKLDGDVVKNAEIIKQEQ